MTFEQALRRLISSFRGSGVEDKITISALLGRSMKWDDLIDCGPEFHLSRETAAELVEVLAKRQPLTVCGGDVDIVEKVDLRHEAANRCMQEGEHPCGCLLCVAHLFAHHLREVRRERGRDPYTGRKI